MFHTFFVAKIIYAHFLSQIQLTNTFCCKNYLSTLFLLQKRFMHIFFHKNYLCTFFVTKRICAHFFLLRKRFRCFFCRENDLRTSPGKFLHVESCYLESSDFWDLCPVHIKRNENYEKKREGDGAVLC